MREIALKLAAPRTYGHGDFFLDLWCEKKQGKYYTKNWVLTTEPDGALVFENFTMANLSRDEQNFLDDLKEVLSAWNWEEYEIEEYLSRIATKRWPWYLWKEDEPMFEE
jgi:hypothetical protein